MKSPAFQWYPRDILSSMRVQEMTLAEEGAYRRLIDYCWLNGYVPSDPKRAARVIGKGASVEITKRVLTMFIQCPDDPEKMYHERLIEEEKKQEAYRNQRVEAANARWKKQGTPDKALREQANFQDDATAVRPHDSRICEKDASAMRKRCSSSSSSSSGKRERENAHEVGEFSEYVHQVKSCRPEFSRMRDDDIAREIQKWKNSPDFEENFRRFIADTANMTVSPENPLAKLRKYLEWLPKNTNAASATSGKFESRFK